MKTTEAVIEFLMPGILACTPVSVLFLSLFGIPAVPAQRTIAFSTFGLFLLSMSYVAGILLGELGTKLLYNASKRTVAGCLIEQAAVMTEAGYEQMRGIDPETITAKNAWREFTFLRAYARSYSDDASSRIQGHENVLRILRPCLVGLPVGMASVAGLFRSQMYHGGGIVTGGLIATSTAVVAFFAVRSAYLQRLGVAVQSAVQHFAAIRARETRAGGDDETIQ